MTRVWDMTLHAAPASWLDSVALWPIAQYASLRGTGEEGEEEEPTLALAFLQVVQALGVTEAGTFLLLPEEVPGLG